MLKLGLDLPREELTGGSRLRVEAMLEQGFFDEVEGLLTRYPPDLKPLQALGYRHLINYLTGPLELGGGPELLTRTPGATPSASSPGSAPIRRSAGFTPTRWTRWPRPWGSFSGEWLWGR